MTHDRVIETLAQREELMDDLQRQINETRALIEESRALAERITRQLMDIGPFALSTRRQG